MMRNCTISGKSALLGGGLYDISSISTKAFNVIIANSPGGGDCVNPGPFLASLTNSLLGSSCGTASPTNIISVDPLLGPLADNGGPTRTFALLTGSPAINGGAASNVSVPIVLTTDQRGVGYSRRCSPGVPAFASVDIGAFEAHESTDVSPPTVAPSQSPVANGTGWNNSDVTVIWKAGISTITIVGTGASGSHSIALKLTIPRED